ncbi:MAG: adenylate kinase [Bacteriovoracia bacterium]
MNPKKIVVIGDSCAGKTTLAKTLASALNVKHVELDALHWEPGWKEADKKAFQERLTAALTDESWVVDGNYTSKTEELVWTRAEMVIWLDPPLATILYRFVLRSFTRAFTREVLWDGCRESLRNSIFKKDSLLVWILTTHQRRKKQFSALMTAGQYPNIEFFHVKTAAERRALLKRFI